MIKAYQTFICFVLIPIMLIGCQAEQDQVQENQEPTKINFTNEQQTSPPTINGTFDKDTKTQEIQNTYTLSPEEVEKRWNAISDESGSGLYINDLQERNGTFQYQFSSYLLLKGTTTSSGVSSIQVIGTPNSEPEAFMMLTAWNQLALLSNPTFTPDDVTDLFREIGVESSSNLQEIQFGEHKYKGHTFHITKEQDVYILTAYTS